MRALGPGSVSSLLKLVLDVMSVILWIFLGLLILLAFIAVLLPVDLDIWREIMTDAGMRGMYQARGPMFAAGLLAAAVLVAMIQFIINRLRRVFQTLTMGDPFHPDNVKRLRHIGFGLAGLQLVSYFSGAAIQWVFRNEVESARLTPSLAAWLAVLVVFVLAEVFREGARLRGEAELTI